MEYFKTEPLSDWLNQPINSYQIGGSIDPTKIYRFVDEGPGWEFSFDEFVENPQVGQCRGLVMPLVPFDWNVNDDYEQYRVFSPHQVAIDRLVEISDRILELRQIFLGDYRDGVYTDVSDLKGGDFSRLLAAYPGLETLHAHVTLPKLEPCRHLGLQSLVLKGSGVDSGNEFLLALGQCVFPSLEELVICIGCGDYGTLDRNLGELLNLLDSNPFPNLKKLGICNCMDTDRIVDALADSEILSQLTSLDLSLGTLTDAGADQLMKSKSFLKLDRLDLFHNSMSDDVRFDLEEHFADDVGVITEAGEAEESPDDRYVAISE